MNPHAGLAGAARKFVRKLGYDVVHHLDFGLLLRELEIDLLIDVGANIGQAYDKFRLAGFRGPIVSFEPHPACFAHLKSRPDKFGNWSRLNIAVGLKDAEQTLYFGPTPDQTSLLTGMDDPSKGSLSVHVRSLESLWPELGFDRYRRVFLKTDAEGFDFQILQGAKKYFDRIAGGMMESRPVPEYDNESPMTEVLAYLSAHGFEVCRVDADTVLPTTGICSNFNVTFCQRNLLLKLRHPV